MLSKLFPLQSYIPCFHLWKWICLHKVKSIIVSDLVITGLPLPLLFIILQPMQACLNFKYYFPPYFMSHSIIIIIILIIRFKVNKHFCQEVTDLPLMYGCWINRLERIASTAWFSCRHTLQCKRTNAAQRVCCEQNFQMLASILGHDKHGLLLLAVQWRLLPRWYLDDVSCSGGLASFYMASLS